MNGKVYNGILDCAARMVKEEGMTSLFKGCGPRVMWITLGGSIFFGTLEKCKQVFTCKHPVQFFLIAHVGDFRVVV